MLHKKRKVMLHKKRDAPLTLTLQDFEPSLLCWVFLRKPLDQFYVAQCCDELAASGQILKTKDGKYRAI